MGQLAVPLMIASTVMSVAGSIQQGQAAAAQGKAQQQMMENIAAAQEAQGLAAQQRAEYVAHQQEQMAGQERAASQRAAMEQQRQKRVAQSRAQAVAASSGGGALDPTVLDIMGGLEDQGNYNALVALYEGESAARNFESQASLTRYEGELAKSSSQIEAYGSRSQGAMYRAAGQNAKKASYLSAAGSALQGGSSLFGKYGAGGPASATSGGLYGHGSTRVTSGSMTYGPLNETINWYTPRYG